MKLLFKQRFFSWLDSYDIFDENGNTCFTVEGKLSWGHRLEIFDARGDHLGTIKEEVLTFMPHFQFFQGAQRVGTIKKEFSLFRPSFQIDCCGWQIEGDFFEWDYDIRDRAGVKIATISKELFRLTDTYVIDVPNPQHILMALMVVLAIDAAKCK